MKLGERRHDRRGLINSSLVMVLLLLLRIVLLLLLLQLGDEVKAGKYGEASPDEVNALGRSYFDFGGGQDAIGERGNYLNLREMEGGKERGEGKKGDIKIRR